MDYVFFGTPNFAKIVLQNLIESDFAPDLVICNPDRPVGRKQVITPPETKVLAQKHGIEVYQPDKISVKEIKKRSSSAKFGIVAAYGKIIPESVIESFPKGIIGVHPSLLPKYRGPTPIRTAMLKGESKTGVSLYFLDQKIDHGPIISQREIEIKDEPYIELKKKLALLGAKMVHEDIPKYIEGEISPEEQDHSKATNTSFFHSDDAKVEYNSLIKAIEGDKKLAVEINRKIKALNPEPGVWTKTNDQKFLSFPKNKRVKLLESHLKNDKIVLDKIHVSGKSKPRKL